MSVPEDGRGRTAKPGYTPPPRLPPHLNPRGRARPSPAPPAPAGRPAPPAGPGPGPRPRRRAGRLLTWVAIATSLTLLVTVGVGYALLTHYDRNINRIDAFGPAGKRPAAAPTDAKNILIVGTDSRGDLEPGEGIQGRGKDFVIGQRSDTVILAHLYGGVDQAQLVSFPRDAWVPIPEHVSPRSGKVVPARSGRLNSAIADGGPPLLIATMQELTGLSIDHYLQIDFDGFQQMVNTLGGVEVCLSKAAKEPQSGIDLPAGRSVVQGEQALAFVRQRDGLPRGDIDRIERQQQFIGAIVRKTLSAGTLLNPFKLNGVVNAATQSLQVDEELSLGDLTDLAMRFRSFDADDVVFATAPIANAAARIQGQSVVLLDEAKSSALFDLLERDIPPVMPDEPGGDDAEPVTVRPGMIQVKVYNGGDVQGLARRAYDDLAAVGFQMVGEPGNRGGSGAGTVVLHGSDKKESARTVVASIPGARAQLDASLGRTLEVVVGDGYSGVRKVTVGAAKPSAPPAPAPKTAAEDPCAA